MKISAARVKIRKYNRIKSIVAKYGFELSFCRSDFSTDIVISTSRFEFDIVLGKMDDWKKIIRGINH